MIFGVFSLCMGVMVFWFDLRFCGLFDCFVIWCLVGCLLCLRLVML